jgi:hypothetical protein
MLSLRPWLPLPPAGLRQQRKKQPFQNALLIGSLLLIWVSRACVVDQTLRVSWTEALAEGG